MWKYYKYWHEMKAYALFRVDGSRVERYAGLERWMVPPFAGRVRMDAIGAGGSWYDIKEITPEEAEEIKRQLFDEEGNRIAPV